MKNIKTLVQDIDDMLSGVMNDGISPEISDDVFKEFGKNCAYALRRQLTARPVDASKNLRVSSLGKCQRVLWYEANSSQPTEDNVGSLVTRFLLGDLIEEVVLAYAKAAGHTVEMEQKEITLTTPDGTESIKGHIDCVIDGHLVDVKSASSYAFKSKFKEGGLLHDDAFGYLDQIASYGYALGNTPIGGFLAMDKQSGELCLYNPPPRTRSALQPDEKLAEVIESNGALDPPERPYAPKASGKSGNEELPINCQYCKRKRECYEGSPLRIFQSSTGPKYLTKIVREPRMQEITWDQAGKL